MMVLELVVQGLKGFPEQRRISFTKGLNAVLDNQDGAPRAATLADALRGLLTYDPQKSYAPRVVDPGSAISRVGATLKAADGTTYRLIHDLKTGAYALHKVKAEGGSFEPVSGNAQEVGQFLRSSLNLPTEDAFHRLLAASGANLPSKRVQPAVMPGMVPGMMPGMMPGMVPGMVPGMMPGMVPGMMQGMMPGMVPGMMPGMMAPGMMAPGAPGMMPGGVMPGGVMPGGVMPGGVVPGGPQPPGALGRQVNFSHLSPEEKKARLEQVKKALAQLKVQQELEFELDGLQRKRFEMDEVLKPVRAAEALVKDCESQLLPFQDLERAPQDLLKQLDFYLRARNTLAEEFRKADEQAQSLQQEAQGSSIQKPWEDRVFQGGLGSSVGLLVVAFGGAAVLEMPALRYLGLFHLVGLGAVVFSLLRYVDSLETREDVLDKASVAEGAKEKAQRRFDLDTTSIRRMLMEFSVRDDKDLESFRERVMARDGLRAALEARRQAAAEARAAAGAGASTAEADQMVARQAEIEAKLQGTSFSGDEKDLKMEYAVLCQELGQAVDISGPVPVLQDFSSGDEDDGGGYPPVGGGQGGGQNACGPDAPIPMWAMASEPPGGGGSGGGGGGRTSSGSHPMAMAGFPGLLGGPPDAVIQLMKAALDLFHVPMEQLGSQVQSRAAQYLQALSDRRFTNLTYTDRGDAAAVDAQGKINAYAAMGAQDQDLVWLATLLSCVELHVKKRPVPVLVDGWFATLADVKHPLLCKMLQYLASVTQVVQFCGRASLVDGAETKITL